MPEFNSRELVWLDRVTEKSCVCRIVRDRIGFTLVHGGPAPVEKMGESLARVDDHHQLKKESRIVLVSVDFATSYFGFATSYSSPVLHPASAGGRASASSGCSSRVPT